MESFPLHPILLSRQNLLAFYVLVPRNYRSPQEEGHFAGLYESSSQIGNDEIYFYFVFTFFAITSKVGDRASGKDRRTANYSVVTIAAKGIDHFYLPCLSAADIFILSLCCSVFA